MKNLMNCKYTALLVSILFFGYLLRANATAQETMVAYDPSTKIEFTITQACSYNQLTELFTYEYGLYSKPTSLQNIWTFEMESPVIVQDISSPAGWSGLYMENLPTISSPIVSWGPDESISELKPGQALTGFSLQSKGVPGIVISYNQGYPKRPWFPEGQARSEDRPKWTEDSVKTKIIGPVPPPSDPFNPVTFTDYIIRMKGEAFALGWIDDREIETSLAQKLFNARKNLGKKDNNASINELKAFIVELVAQKGKHVNDSAFYLLEPNAKYLISRL
jgi:hypothetical protein